MNYFITEQGLQPFDLTAEELLSMLTDNIAIGDLAEINRGAPIKHYRVYQDDNGNKLKREVIEPAKVIAPTLKIKCIQECIDSDNILFKHPDATRDAVCGYTNAGKNAGMSLELLSGLSPMLKDRGIGYIISSLNSEDEYSVQANGVHKPQWTSLMRRLVIGNLLTNLD